MTGERRLWPAALTAFSAFAVAGAFSVWFWMHSGFQPYDDEGFLLITLKQFLDGHKIYDEIFTIYGPFYYGYQALLYRITGWPVSHDAVRLFSMIPWTLVPLLAAWIVFRASRSLPMAALTHLAVFPGLAFFTWEPGQPQEICLILFLLLAAVLSHPGRGPRIAMMAGLLVAMLTLSKVNAGIFAAAAVGLTLVLRASPGTIRNVLLTGAVAVAALMPALLMLPFHGHWVQQWLFAASATVAGALMIALRQRSVTSIPLRHSAISAVACLAGMVAIVTPFLFWGTTVKGMFYMLVVRVGGTNMRFDVPAGFNWQSAVSSAAALLVAGAYLLGWGGRRLADVIILLKLVFGLLVLSAGVLMLARPIFLYASPWVWLVGAGAVRADNRGDSRSGICLLAATQTLWAFPVAYHIAFVSILLIVSAAICLGDSLPELRRRAPQVSRGMVAQWAPIAAFFLFIMAGHLLMLRAAHSSYDEMVPLDLPGARNIRVFPDQQRLYRGVVESIHRRDCSGFLTMPGMNSYYFWAQQNSPTVLNLTNWVGSFDDAEQRRMVNDYARVTRPCVVSCQPVVDFWLQGRPMPQRPLVRWIEENFEPADRVEGCRVLTWKQH